MYDIGNNESESRSRLDWDVVEYSKINTSKIIIYFSSVSPCIFLHIKLKKFFSKDTL